MSIQEKIKNDLKQAMLARDSVRLNVLRGLLAGFTNELVLKMKKTEEGISDEDALTVITRAVKQRKDSIEQFTKGGRTDLADAEKQELTIVEEYKPQSMAKEEILKIAEKKKEELGVTDKAKSGMLVGALMKELKGKADGGDVKEVVDSLF